MPKLSMTFRIAACLLVSVGFCVLASASLQAQTWTETGDAGQTLGTAQAAGVIANQALNQISGTISSATDADLFRFTITAPTTFSATTTGGGLTTLDTALFLFNSSGAAIYTNDDASGASLQSTCREGRASPCLSPPAPIISASACPATSRSISTASCSSRPTSPATRLRFVAPPEELTRPRSPIQRPDLVCRNGFLPHRSDQRRHRPGTVHSRPWPRRRGSSCCFHSEARQIRPLPSIT